LALLIYLNGLGIIQSMKKNNEEMVYQAVLMGELQIDNQGRIWRVAKRGWDRWKKKVVTRKCEKVRAEKPMPSGYLIIRAMFNKRRYTAMAHRLIWHHFNGSIPKGKQINHKNGIKNDNRPENLELVTPSENTQHMIQVLKKGHQINQNGEDNNMSKLTENQIRDIRKRRLNGESLMIIAKDYNIAFQTVSKIARGDRWKHLDFG